MFKKYFDEKPVTEDELDFLDKLNRGRRKAAEEAVSKLAGGISEASRIVITRKLANITAFSSKNKKRSIENKIRDTNSQIDRALLTLRDLRRNLDRYRADLLLLQHNRNQGSKSTESIIDYILNNPCVQLNRVDEGGMALTVRSHLTFFNKSDIEGFIENPDSDIYRQNPAIIGDEIFKRVLISLFVEQKYLIRMTGSYSARFDDCTTHGYGDTTKMNHSYDTWFVNPHLWKFNCLGDNRDIMLEDLMEGDLIDYIEQCITSTESVGAGDPSFNYLITDLVTTYTYDDMRRLPLFDRADNGEICSMQDIVDEITKNNENTAES